MKGGRLRKGVGNKVRITSPGSPHNTPIWKSLLGLRWPVRDHHTAPHGGSGKRCSSFAGRCRITTQHPMGDPENFARPSLPVPGSPHNTPITSLGLRWPVRDHHTAPHGKFGKHCSSFAGRCGITTQHPMGGPDLPAHAKKMGVSSAGLFPGFGPPGELTLSVWAGGRSGALGGGGGRVGRGKGGWVGGCLLCGALSWIRTSR